MKKSILLTFLCVSSLFISCSNDDENGNGADNFTIPLTDGNYWTYDVDSEGIFLVMWYLMQKPTKNFKPEMMLLQGFIHHL